MTTPAVLRCLSFVLLLPLTTAFAAGELDEVPKVKNAKDSGWVFNILPKSFQSNPSLDITVMTEMTEAGKKLPPASSSSPAYYTAICTGYLTIGHAPAGETKPPTEQLDAILHRSLSSAGYLDAEQAKQPPTLAIFYSWGSHSTLIDDAENPTVSNEAKVDNLVSRALLVGGVKFTHQFVEALEAATIMKQSSDAGSRVPGGQAIMSDEAFEFANPVNVFRRQSPTNEFLVDQANSDIYFIVASAYDYQAIAQKKRVLLWRTRMTVSAQGVNMTQSLPALILSAGPYFGKDMPEPAALNRRVKEGRVDVGIPTVVDTPAKSPPPAEQKK